MEERRGSAAMKMNNLEGTGVIVPFRFVVN
jgi:hypothetical protein